MDQNLKQELKSLKIVHAALVMGVLLFLIISIYLTQMNGGLAFDVEKDRFIFNLFIFISNMMAVVSISTGLFVFKNRIKEIAKLELAEKLRVYREAMIIRSATIEGASFFFVVCFFLFGSSIFLIEGAVGLAVLASFYPTNNRIAQEINHNVREFE